MLRIKVCLQVSGELLHMWKSSLKCSVAPEEAACDLKMSSIDVTQWLSCIMGNEGVMLWKLVQQFRTRYGQFKNKRYR